MKVSISSGGKFHSFHLAEELQKRGYLDKLITTYFDPKRNAKGYRIDKSKVLTNLLPAIFSHGFSRIPGLRKWQGANYHAAQIFDKWARSQVEPCDIFVAFAGFGLNTLPKVKKYGAITILERGSCHILTYRKLLKEEFAKLGINRRVVDERLIKKQLREYDAVDYISVPSNFVKISFLKHGVPQKKLLQIPYGVDLSLFQPRTNDDDVFRVIQVGCRIEKGTHYLLQALAELELTNSELILIGTIDQKLSPFMEKYKSVYRALGGVPHTQLCKYYTQGSLYVLPSIQEGLAMTILEAMACGLPVICSSNTGGQDIVRNGIDGYIVPERDVGALKEKILYLYEHEEERKSMGKSAQQRAKEFTWDKYGKRMTETYRQLLEKEK